MALNWQTFRRYLLAAFCLTSLMLRWPLQEMAQPTPPGSTPSSGEIAILRRLEPVAPFYFYALQLLHAGDLHGQQTAIDDYDYAQVLQWLRLLAEMNPTSEIAPFLATFYFSGTSHHMPIYDIIDFLSSYAKENISHRWRWHAYGVYLAHHRLQDLSYAYVLASDLVKAAPVSLPLWVQELPGLLLTKLNQPELARSFFRNLLDSSITLSKEERQYLEEKLKSINIRP